MTRLIFASAALLTLTLTGACTLGPLDGTSLSSRDDPITVWGYAKSPHHEIDIRCWDEDATWEPTAPYVPFDLTFSSDEPFTVAGESVYEFERTTVIFNDDCWTPVPGEGIQEAFIQTYDNPDGRHHDVYDQAGLSCLISEVVGGMGPLSAGAICRDPALQGKGARVTAPL